MTTPHFDLERSPLATGTVLLEASAGTGKTYTLTGLVLRFLLEGKGIELGHLLVVTFTIAATEELKARVRDGLWRALRVCRGGHDDDPFFDKLGRHGRDGAVRLQRALRQFDQFAVSTIHGFCKRLLEDSAFTSSEPFEHDFVEDEIPLLRSAAQDALRRTVLGGDAAVAAVARAGGLDPGTLVKAFRLWQRHPDVALSPTKPDVETHRGRVAAALNDVASAWDDSARTAVAALQFKQDKGPDGSANGQLPDLLARHVCAETAAMLPLLLELAPERLRGTLVKKHIPRTWHPFFVACGELARAHADCLAHLRCHALRVMHGELGRQQARDRSLLFQDLLSRTHAALQDPDRRERIQKELQQRHRVALIDEFQDTDPVQYAIFATCFRGLPLYLIGDPKQSIYGFRGADVRAYRAARRDAEDAHTLGVNFRSSQGLIAAVEQLFAGERPFVDPDIELPTVTARAAADALRLHGDATAAPTVAVRLRCCVLRGTRPWNRPDAERHIAADTAAEIARLLQAGVQLDGRRLLPGDIAVLTRSNLQATTTQQALRAAGVHAVIGKAGDIFDTEELDELERLLLAILQPRHLGMVRAALATRLWGVSLAELAARADGGGDDAFEPELALLDAFRATWLRSGFVVMMEQVLHRLSVRQRLLSRPEGDGERRLSNLLQLIELLHHAEHDHRLSPDGLLRWLAHEREHKEEIDYQRRELRLESDADAVQILTVHGSKGLEYEVVFCPFLWTAYETRAEAVLAPTEAGHELAFDVDRDDPRWLAAETERLAEDLRLCYVAVTRARRRLYLHWCPATNSGKSALAWLLDRPTQFPDHWLTDWRNGAPARIPALQAKLEDLAARSGGGIDLTLVPDAPVATRLPPAPPGQLPPPRPLPAERFPRQLHSFTSLTAVDTTADPEPHDRLDPAATRDIPALAPGSRLPLLGFARGARAGQCLHEILEQVDLRTAASAPPRELVAQLLQQHGLATAGAHPDCPDPQGAVLQHLQDLAAAMLPGAAVRFADLCTGARAVEWQFTLPTHDAALRELANCMTRSGGVVARDYVERLRALPPRTLRGFLTGFADLIALHQGRYWLLDWKSNHLGDDAAGYDAAALSANMQHHDYVLQYHLYLLALHRHLRSRLRNYDYDQHVGGIAYVYLRGVAPGTAQGVFVDRPNRELVEAMDRWAGGGGA